MKGNRFEIYQDAHDEWRWRLVHANGKILADSGEGYTQRAGASRSARRLAAYTKAPVVFPGGKK